MSSINPFDEYEAELLAQSRKETQAELQAWEALSPAEKEAEKNRSIAKHEAWCEALEASESSQDDDDDDDDDDENLRKSEIHALFVEHS